jgi:hypothetical protein
VVLELENPAENPENPGTDGTFSAVAIRNQKSKIRNGVICVHPR